MPTLFRGRDSRCFAAARLKTRAISRIVIGLSFQGPRRGRGPLEGALDLVPHPQGVNQFFFDLFFEVRTGSLWSRIRAQSLWISAFPAGPSRRAPRPTEPNHRAKEASGESSHWSSTRGSDFQPVARSSRATSPRGDACGYPGSFFRAPLLAERGRFSRRATQLLGPFWGRVL